MSEIDAAASLILKPFLQSRILDHASVNCLIMDDLDNISIEETSYKITPDGSEFYHCTPDLLGPQSSQILNLDFSRMRYEGAEIDIIGHHMTGYVSLIWF